MSDHETEQPQPEQEPEPQPEPDQQPQTPSGPRRFLRSRDDRVVGGVAGGLGKYFDVDPVFFRVGFVALAFLGGVGLLLYVAALLFVPSEDPTGGEPPPRSRAVTIGGAVLLVIVGLALLADWSVGAFVFSPLGFLAVLGAAVWWLVRGRPRAAEGTARRALTRIALALVVFVVSVLLLVGSVWVSAAGGGVAVAILVVAIGALIAAAAFRGGLRWLIVPALAMAIGVGVVAAADIDLDGGYGDRTYAPRSLDELRNAYDLGAGSLEVDLRGVDFPTGRRELDLEVGFGEAVLVVPRDVCVVADADVGAGYLRVLEWDDGGFNVGWSEGDSAPPDTRLVVDAHVGMGALQVVHDPRDAEGHDDRWDGPGGRWEDVHDEEDVALGRSAACEA
jgi:phage shock protein PspC (stress-responsive transcriptional regulator)